ncbi:MAG: hypothetical protein ACTSVZ_05885 [Promethearchaeota archaeon]
MKNITNLKQSQRYVVAIVLLSLFTSISTVFAEDSAVWMVEAGSEYEFETRLLSTEHGADLNGTMILTIEEILENGTLIFSIDYDENMENFFVLICDEVNQTANSYIPAPIAMFLVLDVDKYDSINYTGKFEFLQALVNQRNENGANLTAQGWGNEKGYQKIMEGTDESGNYFYFLDQEEWTEEGVLQSNIFHAKFVNNDVYEEINMSVLLKESSIPGFAPIMLSGSIILSVGCLVFLRWRSRSHRK